MSFSNEYTLNVDIKKRMSNVVPIFRQGDTAKLNFRAYDNGVLLDLTSYTRSEITFSLPSGRTLVNECTLENGIISYELVGVEMAEIGNVAVILSIYSNESVVSVQPFRIHIYDNMRGQDLSYITILQDLISEVSNIKDDIAPLAEEILSLKEDLAPLVISVEQGEVERVGNEDERIFNENERIQDESQREDNESIRVTNENTRISKENQRATSESNRTTSEATRVSNESNRVITEGLRVSAENTRNTKETDRVTKETDRVTKETQRVNAETVRGTAEATRVSNEQSRSQAETLRIQNETARSNDENERLDNESARILSETARGTAESTRVSNETDRVTKEAQRVTAESNRANSETTRASKETERLNAETVRVSNETTRGNNEQSRNQAETLRSQNETARSNNENTRKSNEITREQNELLRQETLSEMTEIVDNFDLRGLYSNSITYEKFNTVTYNGSSYMALKTVTGITPSDDGVNWQLLAQRGVDGDGSVSSVNGIMPDTNGNVVIPATEAIDRLDSTSTTNALSANKGRELKAMIDNIEFDASDVIVTSETEPTNQSENYLWFDVSDTAFDSIDIENAVVSTTPPTDLSLLWLDESTEGNITLKKNINGVWKTLNPKTSINQVIEMISGKTLAILLSELKGQIDSIEDTVVDDFNQHVNDIDVHVTQAEKEQFLALREGNTIIEETWDSNKNPDWYYALGNQTCWENLKEKTIGIPDAGEDDWCASNVLIPYRDPLEDKLTQLAYTRRGIYFRSSIGDYIGSTSWGTWNKITTSTEIAQLLALITALQNNTQKATQAQAQAGTDNTTVMTPQRVNNVTGTLSSLTTTAKGNLVAAIAELDNELGGLNFLTTTAKGNLVAAINEVNGKTTIATTAQAQAGTNNTTVMTPLSVNIVTGSLTSLTTTGKSSLVTAINEVNSKTNNASTTVAGVMSAADKVKLDGIATNANNYTLPAATTTVRGGVITGTNIVNSSGTISVPAASTTVAGVMSAADKVKLDGIAAGANNYTLPQATTTALGGVTVGGNLAIYQGAISVASASVNVKGVVQLTDAVNSLSTTTAATANAVRQAYDRAEEAFTQANDIKTKWASVVGGPLVSTDTQAQLQTKTQTIKNTLAANLTAKGTTATGTETLTSLVDKVAQVSTGVKTASGTVTPNRTSPYEFSVTGLDFTPRVVIIENPGGNNRFVHFSDTILPVLNTTSYTQTGTATRSQLTINSSGFSGQLNVLNAINWTAFG